MRVKRKTIEILIAIRVPESMTAKEVQREIKSLINDQCNYIADPEDLRVLSSKMVRS